jgi:prevent-host-death family protein
MTSHRPAGKIPVMKRVRRTVPAREFKARCLELLDEVSARREALVVTKHGRPVAQVVGVSPDLGGGLRGSVAYHGDLVRAVRARWESER